MKSLAILIVFVALQPLIAAALPQVSSSLELEAPYLGSIVQQESGTRKDEQEQTDDSEQEKQMDCYLLKH